MTEDVRRLGAFLRGDWLDLYLSSRPHIDATEFRRRDLDITQFEAGGVMRAFDEGLVHLDETAAIVWPRMHERLCPFHTKASRAGRPGIKFARECLGTVAAACRLHYDLGWPVEHIVLGSSRATRFDLALFRDDAEQDMLLAGEAKRDRQQIDYLLEELWWCATRGPHPKETHGSRGSDPHRKFEGLLHDRPPLLWLIAPDTDMVLSVEYGATRQASPPRTHFQPSAGSRPLRCGAHGLGIHDVVPSMPFVFRSTRPGSLSCEQA